MPFTPQVRVLLTVLVLACAAAGAGAIAIGRSRSSGAASPARAQPAPKSTPRTPHVSRGAATRKVTPGITGAAATGKGTFTWVFSPSEFRGTRLPSQSEWTQADKPLFLKHLGARGLTYADWRAGHALRPSRATARKPAADAARQPAKQPARQPAARDRLPAAIERALAAKRVVVVALFDPKAKLDDTALREARAGARMAGTAFVPVDVTKQGVDALNVRYGAIQDPAVLVLRPPGDLVVRIDGFADRDTVAQAAANAAP